MTQVVSLKKMQEAATVSLAKRSIDVTKLVAQVKCWFDVSGSFYDEHRDGYTQSALNRMFAVAMLVDPDKTLDVGAFSNRHGNLPAMVESNYANYVDQYILRNAPGWFWGGTSFAGFLAETSQEVQQKQAQAQSLAESAIGALKGLFTFGKPAVVTGVQKTEEQVKAECPSLVWVFTDGDNGDEAASNRVLEASQDGNVFYMFVGVGNDTTFPFCTEAKKKFANCDFQKLDDLRNVSDEQLYAKVLASDKLTSWLAKRTKATIAPATV